MLKIRAPLVLLIAISMCLRPIGAAELVLAPAASVVIVDAANPSQRLVITSPPDAALDLTPLLSVKPDESIISIVTRIQTGSAGAITMNADGSLSLSSAPTPSQPRDPTPGLANGLLIYDGGKWTLHPATAPAPSAPNLAATRPAPSSTIKASIFKPGVTREQAERDIAQCRQHAEQAAVQQLRPPEKVASYNAVMYSCLRNFGYEIRS
jgi:hypothetical protein